MDDRRESSDRRFVLLRHELPGDRVGESHWDLMLEFEGVLLTWALPSLDFSNLPQSFASLGIRRLADHRAVYLEYEGPVSGDRGFVQQTDSGVYRSVPKMQNENAPRWSLVQLEGKQYRLGIELPMEIWQQPAAPTKEAAAKEAVARVPNTDCDLSNSAAQAFAVDKAEAALDGWLVYFEKQSLSSSSAQRWQ